MDLASVVAALASVGVRVSGSTPNSSVQVDSSRACPTGLAGPEPSGTINDPGQHFQPVLLQPILLKLHCSFFFFCTPCLCLLFVPFSFSPRNHISLFLHVFSRPLRVIYLFAPAYITAIASAGPTTHFRPLVHNFAVFSP